ncbi:hypothetical protein CVV65_10380 [Kyrpidia spormannii]|uniref:Uncharacterized protein n=1 Tax=Kyrpidia spormannii TaxID=2055160 RepID=A0A2K8N9I7_9BACL|nr:hypothetical protein CVV65_10380 [Kyrpidia spormannii]
MCSQGRRRSKNGDVVEGELVAMSGIPGGGDGRKAQNQKTDGIGEERHSDMEGEMIQWQFMQL